MGKQEITGKKRPVIFLFALYCIFDFHLLLLLDPTYSLISPISNFSANL
jgi:hypothetical protein